MPLLMMILLSNLMGMLSFSLTMNFTSMFLLVLMMILTLMLIVIINYKLSMFIPSSVSLNDQFNYLFSMNYIGSFLLSLLELFSFMIWPVSLCVWIMANLTSSHLLMSLALPVLHFYCFIVFMFYMVFELVVCMVQTYIFILLLSMYINEVKIMIAM